MTTVHVIPNWQKHALEPWCWCQPVYDESDWTGSCIWTHRASSDDPHRYSEAADPALLVPGREWAVVEAVA